MGAGGKPRRSPGSHGAGGSPTGEDGREGKVEGEVPEGQEREGAGRKGRDEVGRRDPRGGLGDPKMEPSVGTPWGERRKESL